MVLHMLSHINHIYSRKERKSGVSASASMTDILEKEKDASLQPSPPPQVAPERDLPTLHEVPEEQATAVQVTSSEDDHEKTLSDLEHDGRPSPLRELLLR